ncbi:Sodium- and chloride-dependent GABA transporter 1, partial [Coemansia sp. RSA 486]
LHSALLAAASTSTVHPPAADMAMALISHLHDAGHTETSTSVKHLADLDSESDDNDFDEEDSVPDPESFVVSSDDRPETFSVGASETLFSDASIFAPGNALFLLDDYQRDSVRRPASGSSVGESRNVQSSLAAAMAIASAIKSRPASGLSALVSGRVSPTHSHSDKDDVDTDSSNSDSASGSSSEAEPEAGSKSGSPLRAKQNRSAFNDGLHGMPESKRALPNESDDDEHNRVFFVDPNALTGSSSDMYFDDGGFTRFLRMHVKRQQERNSPTATAVIDPSAHMRKPSAADIEMVDTSPPQSAKESGVKQQHRQGRHDNSLVDSTDDGSQAQRHRRQSAMAAIHTLPSASATTSSSLPFGTDMSAHSIRMSSLPFGFSNSSALNSFIAPSLDDGQSTLGNTDSSLNLGGYPGASSSSLTAIPNANPFMLPGNGQGPIMDSDPITAAFYSGFGLQPPPVVSSMASLQSAAAHGLNPSSAAALASQLAQHQQLTTAAAAVVAASAQMNNRSNTWRSMTISVDSPMLGNTNNNTGGSSQMPPPQSAKSDHNDVRSMLNALANVSGPGHQSRTNSLPAASVHSTGAGNGASTDALQMLYFSQFAPKADDSALPLPLSRAATLGSNSGQANGLFGMDVCASDNHIPRTINPSAIDLPAPIDQQQDGFGEPMVLDDSNNNNNNNGVNVKKAVKRARDTATTGNVSDTKGSSRPRSQSPSTKRSKHGNHCTAKQPTTVISAGDDHKSTIADNKPVTTPSSSVAGPNNTGGSPQMCSNCSTTTTPLWRRDPEGKPLCNACGLFFKLHGVTRPLSLKTNVIKKRNRSAAKKTSGAATTGTSVPSNAGGANGSSSAQASSSGANLQPTKQPLQQSAGVRPIQRAGNTTS